MSIVRIGDGVMRTRPAEEIGAKAANLARVASARLASAAGLRGADRVCAAMLKATMAAERALWLRLEGGDRLLKRRPARDSGTAASRLLVSVRSGAHGRCPACSTLCSMSAAPAKQRAG